MPLFTILHSTRKTDGETFMSFTPHLHSESAATPLTNIPIEHLFTNMDFPSFPGHFLEE